MRISKADLDLAMGALREVKAQKKIFIMWIDDRKETHIEKADMSNLSQFVDDLIFSGRTAHIAISRREDD